LRGVFVFAMPISSVSEVKDRIDSACRNAGREVSSVTLIGASKMVPAARLEGFQQDGLLQFGENYIQEGVEKVRHFQEKGLEATWHFIGALQSNKAREAVAHFDLIHSVDRLSLARELDKEARKIGKVQPVLLQVNVGGESSKAGTSPEELPKLWEAVASLQNLRIEGLMSLPPFREVAEESRPYHRALRELLLASPLPSGQLSMGMSHDFEIAIEEGATLIRVGTALFGARS
jgi:pyridoxal phosphate enzyme (YggS family)